LKRSRGTEGEGNGATPAAIGHYTKRFWRIAAIVASLLITTADAQTYPARPIRLIVPFPAGGTADVIARAIVNEASTQLTQPFVIDTRGGANGIIGTDIVAKAAPDGHTLLYVTASFVINPHIYTKLPYDVFRDFDPLTNAILGTGYLVVLHPAVQAPSVKALVALARDSKLSYSSPGVGNTLHLAAELFATRAGIKLLHVPYKGVAPALNAVMAGEVQMTLIPPTIALAQVKAGRVKAIAFTGSSRFAGLPQLPTVSEAGVANVELTGAWQGFFAPAKTAPPAMTRLQQELARALQAPKVRELIVAGGYEPDGRSGAAFASFLRTEYERYAEMVRVAGISKTDH
jgi:tripartite-type tricarboxylate transporter receptor subunit TctC